MMAMDQGAQRFQNDAFYVRDRWEELLQQFPDRWIAVYGQKVVTTARTHKELVAKLRRKGVPPAEAYTKFLATDEPFLIVPSA